MMEFIESKPNPEIEYEKSKKVIEHVVQKIENHLNQHRQEKELGKRINTCDFSSAATHHLVLYETQDIERKNFQAKVIDVYSLLSAYGVLKKLDRISRNYFLHGMCLVRDPDGRLFVIDNSYSQFIDNESKEIRQGHLRSGINFEGNSDETKVAKELYENGYILLTPSKFYFLVKILTDKKINDSLKTQENKIDIGAFFEQTEDLYSPHNWSKKELDKIFFAENNNHEI